VKNAISRGAVFVAVLTALVFASAAPAHADEVSDAVATLQAGSSYVAPGLSAGTPDPGFAGQGIGVVVMEVNGNSAFTPNQIAAQIQGQLGSEYSTIIVVNADPTSNISYGVVPGTSSAAILPILAGGSGVDNLNANQGAITSALATTTTPVTSGGSDFDAAPVVVGGGLVLALAVIVTLVIVTLKRVRGKKVKAVTTKAINSDKLKSQLEKLADIIERYRALKYVDFANELSATLSNINELFARLERKGSKSQKGVAEVEYTTTLERLNGALGEDYYIDIARRPDLWDRPNERLSEVRSAAKAVDAQILENIKQVNSSRDLDFRVALDALLRSVDQPNAQDMITKPSTR